MPNVQISDRPMFLRLIHADSDSGDVGAGFAPDAQPGDWPALLRARFAIDSTRLEQAARRGARG